MKNPNTTTTTDPRPTPSDAAFKAWMTVCLQAVHEHGASHGYIWVESESKDSGRLTAWFLKSLPDEFLKRSKTSGNKGPVQYMLRTKPAKDALAKAKATAIKVVDLKTTFEDAQRRWYAAYAEDNVFPDRPNRGEIFELAVREFYGLKWHKESIPFWEDGDISIDGHKWQIKSMEARFLTESHLKTLGYRNPLWD